MTADSWRVRAIVFTTIALAVVALSFRAIYEPDLFWHFAQGRENVTAQLVRTNLFSDGFADYRQHYTSWLFDTSAYLAWRAAGDAGMQTLQALLLVVALLFVYRAGRLHAPASVAVSLVLLAVPILEPRALPRPHLVSFAGTAIVAWLLALTVTTGSARRLWWAVPLVVVWSNAHVEAVFGVLLIGLFAASETLRPALLRRSEALRALAVAAACAVALLANPYGWGLVAYLVENVGVPRIMRIAELMPPPPYPYRAFYLYLAILGVALASTPRRTSLGEWLIAVVFAALGLRYLRLTPLVCLATAPFVASRLNLLVSRGVDGRAIVATAVLAAALFSRLPPSAYLTPPRFGGGALTPPEFFSRGAIAFARDHGLHGPLFNSHNLGGYLAWTLYPEARVFQDSRLQAYPAAHFTAIIDATRTIQSWEALVAGLDWAMLSTPRPNQLSGVGLFPSSRWATVYADDAVEVVVRRTGRFGGLAAPVAAAAVPNVLHALQQRDDVTGRWTASFESHDGPHTLTFAFEQKGSQLTGSVGDGTTTTAIADGRVEGQAVNFVTRRRVDGKDLRVTFAGTIVSGTEIHFTRTAEGRQAEELVATRSTASP